MIWNIKMGRVWVLLFDLAVLRVNLLIEISYADRIWIDMGEYHQVEPGTDLLHNTIIYYYK